MFPVAAFGKKMKSQRDHAAAAKFKERSSSAGREDAVNSQALVKRNPQNRKTGNEDADLRVVVKVVALVCHEEDSKNAAHKKNSLQCRFKNFESHNFQCLASCLLHSSRDFLYP